VRRVGGVGDDELAVAMDEVVVVDGKKSRRLDPVNGDGDFAK